MAKCKYCNSCLQIYRVDWEIESVIYMYCDFCYRIYKFPPRLGEETEEISNIIRERLRIDGKIT